MKDKEFWIQLFEESEIWKLLLFAIFGFFVGFTVCPSVNAVGKMTNGRSPKMATERFLNSGHYDEIIDVCTCVVAQLSDCSILCNYVV